MIYGDFSNNIVTINDNLVITGTFTDGNYTFDTSGNVSGLGTVASGAITSTGTIQGTTITATTAVVPDAADGATLGSASLEWSDLYMAEGSVIYFGADQDVKLTHLPDTGLQLKHTGTSDNKPMQLTIQTGETDIQADDVHQLLASHTTLKIGAGVHGDECIRELDNKSRLFTDEEMGTKGEPGRDRHGVSDRHTVSYDLNDPTGEAKISVVADAAVLHPLHLSVERYQRDARHRVEANVGAPEFSSKSAHIVP